MHEPWGCYSRQEVSITGKDVSHVDFSNLRVFAKQFIWFISISDNEGTKDTLGPLPHPPPPPLPLHAKLYLTRRQIFTLPIKQECSTLRSSLNKILRESRESLALALDMLW